MEVGRRLVFLARICLLIGLLLSAYFVIRQGVGAWYFRKGGPEAVQSAIQWDSGNPQYFDALGSLMHFYADAGNPKDIVSAYQTATRLSSHNAYYWADLGAAYDWAGRPDDALRAFEQARQLFPNSPDINWRLANFYVRAGKTSEALRALQKVLAGDNVARHHAFALATSATRDTNAILSEMLPVRADIYFEYLDFLIAAGKMDAAEMVWARVLERNVPFELRQVFPYLDALIQHREPERAAETWSALAGRLPAQIHRRAGGRDLITNGSFELDILDGGLDWRILPVEGAIVSLDSANAVDGARSLRIEFDGKHNLDFYHVLQYVPVKPDTRYRFSGSMRVNGITTQSGPRFQIYDTYDMPILFLSTSHLVGISDWQAEQVEFKTGAATRLLVIRVARPASRKLDNRIAGAVWIDDVRLESLE
ncbi:MAG TPA: tetratricopeptide repeat protein [Candidatus Acidoferrum sp.]|nr:tetratricopeptide repeat protein [Candidatus Acidoferrum sp.]